MSPRLFASLVVLVGLALGGWARAPALDAGFWADDYMQFAMLEHAYPSPRAAWDLFHFVDGSKADHARIVEFGVDPWWTHPQFRLSLFRPLPSLLRAFDHALFKREAAAQHWHSFVWCGLLIAAVAWLFFTVLPPWAAACGVLLYSVEESLTVPVLWLSNRSALVATTFALVALTLHIRWRARPAPGLRAASIAFLVLALASGEYAVASFGYFLAYELSTPTDGVSRARALAPLFALTLLFLALSAALGYGSAHSALYTSPLSSPLAYAAKLVTGLPVLSGELTLGVSADFWHFGTPWPAQLRELLGIGAVTWDRLPSWHAVQLSLGLLGATLVWLLLWWLRKTLKPTHMQHLRWLTVGAALALLPVLGSFVTSRLVMPAAVGVAALFGSVVAEGLRALSRRSAGSIALGVVAALVVYVHGYRAFAETQRTTELYAHVSASRTAWPLSLVMNERQSPSQQIVMIAAADANDAPHLPFVRYAWGRSMVRGFRLLSGAPGSHDVVRVDANTIEVIVMDEFGLDGSVAGSLTRDTRDEMRPGYTVRVGGMQARVLRVVRGQPVHVRFRFDVPLEDPSLVFMYSMPEGLRRLSLPPIGQRMHLPPPVMPEISLLAQPHPSSPE